MFAEGKVLQSGGELICFLHAGAHRAATRQHQDIFCLNAAFLYGCNGFLFTDENTGRAFLVIDPVGIDHCRIDGGAFDDGTFGSKVASWKS